jgi:hypothetical protein
MNEGIRPGTTTQSQSRTTNDMTSEEDSLDNEGGVIEPCCSEDVKLPQTTQLGVDGGKQNDLFEDRSKRTAIARRSLEWKNAATLDRVLGNFTKKEAKARDPILRQHLLESLAKGWASVMAVVRFGRAASMRIVLGRVERNTRCGGFVKLWIRRKVKERYMRSSVTSDHVSAHSLSPQVFKPDMFFGVLPREVIDAVCQRFHRMECFVRGEAICYQGTPERACWVLVEGSAEAKEGEQRVSIAAKGTNAVINGMSALMEEEHRQTVIVSTPYAIAVRVSSSTVHSCINEHFDYSDEEGMGFSTSKAYQTLARMREENIPKAMRARLTHSVLSQFVGFRAIERVSEWIVNTARVMLCPKKHRIYPNHLERAPVPLDAAAPLPNMAVPDCALYLPQGKFQIVVPAGEALPEYHSTLTFLSLTLHMGARMQNVDHIRFLAEDYDAMPKHLASSSSGVALFAEGSGTSNKFHRHLPSTSDNSEGNGDLIVGEVEGPTLCFMSAALLEEDVPFVIDTVTDCPVFILPTSRMVSSLQEIAVVRQDCALAELARLPPMMPKPFKASLFPGSLITCDFVARLDFTEFLTRCKPLLVMKGDHLNFQADGSGVLVIDGVIQGVEIGLYPMLWPSCSDLYCGVRRRAKVLQMVLGYHFTRSDWINFILRQCDPVRPFHELMLSGCDVVPPLKQIAAFEVDPDIPKAVYNELIGNSSTSPRDLELRRPSSPSLTRSVSKRKFINDAESASPYIDDLQPPGESSPSQKSPRHQSPRQQSPRPLNWNNSPRFRKSASGALRPNKSPRPPRSPSLRFASSSLHLSVHRHSVASSPNFLDFRPVEGSRSPKSPGSMVSLTSSSSFDTTISSLEGRPTSQTPVARSPPRANRPRENPRSAFLRERSLTLPHSTPPQPAFRGSATFTFGIQLPKIQSSPGAQSLPAGGNNNRAGAGES